MTKHFVVATDPMSAQQEIEFKKTLPGHVGWWHWLPNFWLVLDTTDGLSAGEIRDIIHRINSTVRSMVLEVQPVVWEALVKPDAQGNKMEEWLNDQWASL